jgi:hypothetical protein
VRIFFFRGLEVKINPSEGREVQKVISTFNSQFASEFPALVLPLALIKPDEILCRPGLS